MKMKLKFSLIILLLFTATVFARDIKTATNFFSINAGLSSSFITGASFYQHQKFMNNYRTELNALNYKVSSSILPTSAISVGIKYGIPFNDKIMIFTGLFYTPRGYTENFSISDSTGLIDKSKFQMIANYWDFYLGLKYKNSGGITLGIGAMSMYNTKDLIKIKRTKLQSGTEVSTETQQLFNEYYNAQRDIFPIAPFICVGYEQRWWNVELESSYSSNIFLATEVEMNFVSVNLKAGFVMLWD
ncbi:MAG: hypothetical protein NT150_06720 [Bacteroidetes bacterium]|nr:hypothetical protein [Bacteroidota bacterium]